MSYNISVFMEDWPGPPAAPPVFPLEFGWNTVAIRSAYAQVNGGTNLNGTLPPGYAYNIHLDFGATFVYRWWFSEWNPDLPAQPASPIADHVINSPDISMGAPNLTFSSDIIGKEVPWVLGTMAVNGDCIWAQGVISPDQLVTSSTLSLASGLCKPIDPAEVVTLGREWGNDKTIYTPTDGPLLVGMTVPTLYQGTETQLPDPLILADKGADNTPAYRGLRYAVHNQFPIAQIGLANPRLFVEMIAPARIRLDDAITKILARAGMSVTVNGVDNMISGAMFESGIQGQDFLRLLHEAYGIDVVSENPLVLTKRAVGVDLVIDHVRDFSDPLDRASKNFKFTREDDTQVPQVVTVTYFDAARRYDQNIQPYRRPKFPAIDTISTAELNVRLPFSITSTEAKQLAAEISFRKRAEAAGATWDDDDTSFQQGDTCTVTTQRGTFLYKLDEVQRRPDGGVSVTASAMLGRFAFSGEADAGDLLSAADGVPYRLWEILRPEFLKVIDGSLYDPVFAVEDTRAGFLHLFFNAIPDTINARQILLGDATVFGDAWIAGADGAYTYIVNSTHITRIQRVYPFNHQTLTFTFIGGAGYVPPAIVAGGFLRVVSTASGGAALTTLDLSNFDASGVTTVLLTTNNLSIYGLVETPNYVVVSTYDNTASQAKIFRVTKADDTVVSLNVSDRIGECVASADGSTVWFYPRSIVGTLNSIGSTYDVAANTQTSFDTSDDIGGSHGVLFGDGNGIALNDTKLAFLIGTDTPGATFEGAVQLATRLASDMSVVAQFDLADIPGYDPETYNPQKLLVAGTNYIVSGVYWRPEAPSGFGDFEAFLATISDDLSTIKSLQPARPSAPANDDFDNAFSASDAFPNTGTNTGATAEASRPDIGGQAAKQDVWWVYTATATGDHIFDATACNFQCRIAVYTGTAVGSLSEVASASSGSLEFGASLTASLTDGDVVHFVVDSKNASSGGARAGNISFTITPP